MFPVYTFDYDTGIYTGIRLLDITDADPRAPGVILMPGNTTTVPPPYCGRGLFPVWRDIVSGHGNSWKHRFTLAGIDHHAPEFRARSIRAVPEKVVQDAIVRSKGRTGDVRYYFSL